MSFSLTLVYKQSQRLCQPRSDRSVNQELIARNVPRRLRPSNDSVANGKYGRSLPLPLPESKAFSRLRAHLFMFFRLRIYATHTRVVSDAVDCQHVGRSSRVDRMRIGITAQIIKARLHCVPESFVHNVFAPKISHSILDPFKIRDSHASGVGQDIG